MPSGFTGVSFPFRVGVKGGVVMSSTSVNGVPHIVESMEQILLTRPLERCMEYHIKSDIDADIFSPNDSSARTLIAYQVEEALKELEDRIEVTDVVVYSRENEILVDINFKVLMYNAAYNATLKVGAI